MHAPSCATPTGGQGGLPSSRSTTQSPSPLSLPAITFSTANRLDARFVFVLPMLTFVVPRQIDPKRAIPREEHLRNTRYFVGGLSPSTNADSMREFFSTFGKVIDATVMVDRESGRSKGFGFVTFEDATNSDQFVGKLGLILDDKQASAFFPLDLDVHTRQLTARPTDRSQDCPAPQPTRPSAESGCQS